MIVNGETCSFCGKEKHEVEYLVLSMSVCICDDCVKLAQDIINEQREYKQCSIKSVI